MSAALQSHQEKFDPADIMRGLYGDGIIGLKGAFERSWVQRLREDIDIVFESPWRRLGARTESLLYRNSRLRRSCNPPVGHCLRVCSRPELPHRRDRLRRSRPRIGQSAMAPRLPRTGRDTHWTATELTRIQYHDG